MADFELKDRSEEVRQLIQQRLVGGLNNANSYMIGEAQAGAPVESGTLRDNTEIVKEASESSPIAIGASKAPYARRVNRDRTPFWTVAILKMKDRMGNFFSG